ncbi:hypothetical protein [Devosia faecipullorum]|uniref:hypothetical protein n=1 Tax=Devosia faecipullorum TaxID=2755039 RepID=UPI00187BA993|nr:hypothetical protein [Devosia faecipullorum]MBE7731677.1 hypothetical protein [Devosia faecipullorum]
MTYKEPLSQMAVAISISESDDLSQLGLAEEHLHDAMAEMAGHFLAMGARLVYGGDLRANGFTELLYELVARHRRDADIGDKRPAVISYLSWPVHSMKSAKELVELRDELQGVGELHCLDENGMDIAMDNLATDPSPSASERVWSDSLTAMRNVMTKASDARVVVGGRVTKFKGRMPGIAEETVVSLDAKQPVYLMGGFGGCARDIAVDMGVMDQDRKALEWPGRRQFDAFNISDFNNGLQPEEIKTLARTVHVDEAIALILRGLLRLSRLES